MVYEGVASDIVKNEPKARVAIKVRRLGFVLGFLVVIASILIQPASKCLKPVSRIGLKTRAGKT